MTATGTSQQRGGRVTIFDVAQASGVSYSTVSRVVNGRRHIAPDTRARVEQAMAELGYVADLRARSLAGGRTHILGLVLLDINSGYMTDTVRAVDDEVSRSGYDLMLCTTHARHGDPSAYVRRLAPGVVDGLMIVAPMQTEKYLAALQSAHFPHVMFDHFGPAAGSSVIRSANAEGVAAGVQHLLDLGHTHIAHVRGDPTQDTATIRDATFLAQTRAAGVRAESVAGCYQERSGYDAAAALLDRPVADRPTAVFAANDASATGVLRAAYERGIRVPDELSVMGFDDVREARLTSPQLTTIRQPLDEMGRVATRLLLEHVADPDREPELVELPTELVVRDSTAPPPRR